MQPDTKTIIAELKQAKLAGLTFEQAKEKLVMQGYRDGDIVTASYEFNFAAYEGEPAQKKTLAQLPENALQQIGEGMLHDRAVSGRGSYYLYIVPVVIATEAAYRYYLKQWTEIRYPRLTFFNDHVLRTEIYAAVAPALATGAFIRFCFFLKDRKFRRRQKSLRQSAA